jgi:hypothetical protein
MVVAIWSVSKGLRNEGCVGGCGLAFLALAIAPFSKRFILSIVSGGSCDMTKVV